MPVTISNINPLTGSLGGGSTLTVTGTGFSLSTDVTIDGKLCEILSVSSTEIVCITPPSSSDTTFDVVVTSNNKSDSFDGYTYDSSSTPTVTSLNPTMSSSPKGKSLLIFVLISYLIPSYSLLNVAILIDLKFELISDC